MLQSKGALDSATERGLWAWAHCKGLGIRAEGNPLRATCDDRSGSMPCPTVFIGVHGATAALCTCLPAGVTSDESLSRAIVIDEEFLRGAP